MGGAAAHALPLRAEARCFTYRNSSGDRFAAHATAGHRRLRPLLLTLPSCRYSATGFLR